MCRIATIISKKKGILQKEITAMADAMHRGGPDDSGYIVNEDIGYALGHRRLSIIDLSQAGHQPMANENIEIVFNGEIYNYKELKEELTLKGCSFFSNSDTEVLIKGYKTWGVEMLPRLRGMFAFVLIDKSNKTLLAARDHAGIKPLYMGQKDDDIYFSSEVRGLKAATDWTENPKWKMWFLTYGFLPEPVTTLQGVTTVPRGHYLNINLETKEHKAVAYHQYEYKGNIVDYNTAVSTTKHLVRQSVQRHLVADVPVGVFLSGGIDSSILAIIAQQQQKSPIETISIYFDDEKYSEKEYQELIIKKTGVKHHLYKITKEEFLNSWIDIYHSLDQPSVDAINTHFICKYAKQLGLKVVLSGLGADEIFGGYPSFNRVNKFGNYNRLAILNRLLLKSLSGGYPRKKIDFLDKQIQASEYLLYRGLFTPSDTAKILQVPESEVWKELSNARYQESMLGLATQDRAAYYETSTYMQSQLLKDSDMQSMWHSLELRVPFLDKDLMDYVNNLHPSVKYHLSKTKPKSLLVDAFIDELPQQIWNRPKQGFTFPFENWFKTMNVFKNTEVVPAWAFDKFNKHQLNFARLWAIFLTAGETVLENIDILE